MDLSKVFFERRSVNFFKKGIKISRDELKAIIELASLAPSSSNTQPWETVVVDEQDKKEELKKAGFNQEKIVDASAVLILLGNPDAYKKDNPIYKSFIENGYMKEEEIDKYLSMIENLYSNFETPMNYAVKNAAMFAISVMYAAKSFNWDTHPMIGFNPDEVKKIFNIPENKKILMLIAIGKFDDSKTLLQRNKRKSFEDICSFNNYEEKKSLKLDNIFLQLNKVTLKDKTFNLLGNLVKTGSEALNFNVLDKDLKPVSLDNLLDKPLVISTVPSIDTPVCKIQTKNIDDFFNKHKDKYNYITISCDSVFALNRFKQAENIKMPMYSDFLNREFSLKYGLLINELGLCARSLIVIDTDKKIKYFQLVKEVSNEPDYKDLVDFLAKM